VVEEVDQEMVLVVNLQEDQEDLVVEDIKLQKV
jgi:hypothetical protein